MATSKKVPATTDTATDTATDAVATPAEKSTPDTAIVVTEKIMIDYTDIDGAVATYAAATTGEKTKIRYAVDNAMKSAMRVPDMDAATAWVSVSDAIAAAGVKVAAPTDYTQIVIDRIRALRYAAHIMSYGDVLPEGVEKSEIDFDRINAAMESDATGDNDAVTDDIANAGRRIAGTKITRSTVRGSIEDHIQTAFAGLPVGTKLTVAQIRTRSGAASDGAIAARVWPRNGKESTLDFVAMGVAATDVDGVRGLVKVVEFGPGAITDAS